MIRVLLVLLVAFVVFFHAGNPSAAGVGEAPQSLSALEALSEIGGSNDRSSEDSGKTSPRSPSLTEGHDQCHGLISRQGQCVLQAGASRVDSPQHKVSLAFISIIVPPPRQARQAGTAGEPPSISEDGFLGTSVPSGNNLCSPPAVGSYGSDDYHPRCERSFDINPK